MPLRDRANFTDDQIEIALDRQTFDGYARCPCCECSLSHVDWDAHHRDGDRTNNATSNLVLPCARCHHECYHQRAGKPRMPRDCVVLA
jgi:hypothetical protein